MVGLSRVSTNLLDRVSWGSRPNPSLYLSLPSSASSVPIFAPPHLMFKSYFVNFYQPLK